MRAEADVPEPASLSRERYIAVLDDAKARGYRFARFADLDDTQSPLIVLRHDVDFAPEFALQMAELEHAQGVAATYFVLVDGQHYDPTTRQVIEQLRAIAALGHEIGLHFTVGESVHDELADEIAFRGRLLADLAGVDIRSFSQHDPVNAGFASVRLPRWVDAYEAVRRHDLLYVSDSAMMWREHTFESALATGRDLCLLSHPHSWLHPQQDYVALIRDLQATRVAQAGDGFDRFVANLDAYYARRREEGA
jgi:hypothetical protein